MPECEPSDPCYWSMDFDEPPKCQSTSPLPLAGWDSTAWGIRGSGQARLYLDDWQPLSSFSKWFCWIKKALRLKGTELADMDANPKSGSHERTQSASWLELDGKIGSPSSMVATGERTSPYPGLRVWDMTLRQFLDDKCMPGNGKKDERTVALATAVNVKPAAGFAHLDESLFAGLIVYQDEERYFAFGRRGGSVGRIVAYVRKPGMNETEVIPIPRSEFSPGPEGVLLVEHRDGKTVKVRREWDGSFWIRLELKLQVGSSGLKAHWRYGHDARVWRQDDQCEGSEKLQKFADIAQQGLNKDDYVFGDDIDPSQAHVGLVCFTEVPTGAPLDLLSHIGEIGCTGQFLSLVVLGQK